MNISRPQYGRVADAGSVVVCAVCGIDVPPDEAVVPEAADRLMYICGLDCYARWRRAAAAVVPIPRV